MSMLLRAILVVVIGILAGCSSGPKVVKVTGTVTRAGKPVPGVVVNFVPVEGRPSWGLTNAQGQYSLNYDREQDGAVVGKHTVWIEYRPGSPLEEDAIAAGKLPKGRAELREVLQKYSEKNSPL